MNNSIIKIAVCDDTVSDRQNLISLLQKYADANNIVFEIDQYESGEKLLCTDVSQCQLVFLDIYMNEMNGMETAKKLISVNSKVQVVFVSTSIDFAAEAFSIEALNYIVKPVTEDRLSVVLTKFIEQYYFVRTIPVKVGRIQEDIYISDLIWIESKSKRSILHMKTGELECSNSISELADLLPLNDYCKPIRWALVSMREITTIPSDKVTLSDSTEIPVSRGQREEIKNQFAQFKWQKMRNKLGVR